MPRILIADDHGLYRKGLRSALEAGIVGAEVLEADAMEPALAMVESDPAIDLVLLDLNMPGLVSFESLRTARECFPRTRFAILSASDAKGDVLSSLAAGLHGFISKLQTEEEIIAAVKDVLAGRIYVPPWMAQVREHGTNGGGPSDGLPSKFCNNTVKLTPRQRDVLPLLARGMSNKEIARALNVSEATIKIHAAGLLRVLAVRNRTEAAVVAREFLEPHIPAQRRDRTGSTLVPTPEASESPA